MTEHREPVTVPVHRDDDGELVGFVAAVGDEWVACTVFHYPLGEPTDAQTAQDLLQSHGLSYLAEPWELLEGDEWYRVTIVEADPEQVTVALADPSHPEDWGARRRIDAPATTSLRRA